MPIINSFNQALNTGMNDVKAYFAFGRMNPFSSGHRRIVDKLLEEAQNDDSIARLYLSKSHDNTKNPLTPEQKLYFARKLFPDLDIRLSTNLFTAALEMASENVDDGVLIVGADRFQEFSKLLSTYAGTEVLGLRHAEVKAISRNDSDASATRMRDAARIDDWKTFCELSPTQDEDLTRELYEAVRTNLEVS